MQEPVYLTEERYNEILKEIETLKTKDRKEISERLKAAKELGDLSENSEYKEAREAQDRLERRINTLEDISRNFVIIKKPQNALTVRIGSKVVLKKGDTNYTYTIVGSAEASPSEGFISNNSPLGKAVLGKKAGDEAVFKTPKGETKYKVVKVS